VRRVLVTTILALICVVPAAVQERLQLPNKEGSIKFLVIGDSGTGGSDQLRVANRIAEVRKIFPFEFAIMVGDNMYGREGANDFRRKFEEPYKPLLDGGVKFYAALGNHDEPSQRFYEHFNMDGQRYYSFKAPRESVRFFSIDSTYLVPEQLKWLEDELQRSGDDWKIAYFHHPPYSSGDRHGSDEIIRKTLEPLFVKYNVSVVFNGHDHFYERITPQQGIVYFVVGSGGKLRRGNIDRRSGLTARGFDTDNAFLMAEIDDDEMFFNAVSRTGEIVDSGVVSRRK
jgi:predicted MPP superfamily phosphohydrolase